MSNIECVVLGLLQEGFRYGHELDRALEQRHMRDWSKITRASIYQVLPRLTQRGWVESRTERDGRMPERTVYTVTPAGEAALREMIANGLASDEPVRFDYSVPLAYLEALPPDEALACVKQRRAKVAEMAATADVRLKESGHLALGGRANLRHAQLFYQMERDWLDWLIEELSQKVGANG